MTDQDRIAALRSALTNLLDVCLAIDDLAYQDACRRTGIYMACDVAAKALRLTEPIQLTLE